MRVRSAVMVILVATACACRATPPDESTDPRAEVQRLIDRSAKLESFTATYEVRGPIEKTVVFTYLAPDRIRVDHKDARSRSRNASWILGDRVVARNDDSSGASTADFTFTQNDQAVLGANTICAAIARAFPPSSSGDTVRGYGPGGTFQVWFEPDRASPDEGEFDLTSMWLSDRHEILSWLPKMLAMPLLRDDGLRIVAEDPATRLVVAVSKANGFIERITTAGDLSIVLADWKTTADPSAFEIPPPSPGARDVSSDVRGTFEKALFLGEEISIRDAVLNAKKHDGIGDDELRRRLTSVYGEMLPMMMAETLAQYRDARKRYDLTAELRRLRAAARSDPDLQPIFDQQVARMREEFADISRKMVEAFTWANERSSEAIDAAPTLALIDEVRRQSMTEMFDREIVKPDLAYFDDCVRAVREEK